MRRLVLFGITFAVLASLLVGAGCSSRDGGEPDAGQQNASAASAAGAIRGGERSNEGGSVTVKVSWDGGLQPLAFEVTMDTHSVDLDGYDLAQLAVLRNSRGEDVKPSSWDAPAGGHHRSGTLTFDGPASFAEGVSYIELVIGGVAGVGERTFRWAAGA